MRSPSSTAAGGPGVPTSLRKVSIHPDDVPTASASSASPALVEHYEASLTDEDAIDTRLLIHVLEHICMQLPSLVELNPSLTPSIAVDGAVLVFLPGWDEIVTVELELKKHAVSPRPFSLRHPLSSLLTCSSLRRC